MRSSSPPPTVERARPLLGTTVAIRVSGLPARAAQSAIDAAFVEIAKIHRLMSFHEEESDIMRLNRRAFIEPVAIDAQTLEVLRWSQELALASAGCFDITTAVQLVAWGLLPSPLGEARADRAASWRDIELSEDGSVRFHRRLLIDLGGIAKGYAVDRAIEILAAQGAEQACVNAGGDLRILGPATEQVRLRGATDNDTEAPMIEIENGSVASSGGALARRHVQGRWRSPHVHGQWRRNVGSDRFACVIAERCLIADALTKIVLASANHGEPLLQHYGATAHLYSPRRGWRAIGALS